MNTQPNTPASRNEARYSFVCNAGCGVCAVKVAPFEYERTETLEGEHLGSKYQPQIVSACCGAAVHVYDNEADHWGAEVTLAAPGAAIDAREQEATGASNLVPGQMHCARCKFQLTRTTLYMGNGAVGAGDSKTEPCPNGCGPLWPVTWEQAARDAWATCETMFERAKKAEDALEAVGGPRLVAAPTEALSAATGVQPVEWEKLRENLAIAMLGFASREGHKSLEAAEQMLDALADGPMPYLRAASRQEGGAA